MKSTGNNYRLKLMQDAEAETEALKRDPKLPARKAKERTKTLRVEASSTNALRNPLVGVRDDTQNYDREFLREQLSSMKYKTQ